MIIDANAAPTLNALDGNPTFVDPFPLLGTLGSHLARVITRAIDAAEDPVPAVRAACAALVAPVPHS